MPSREYTGGVMKEGLRLSASEFTLARGDRQIVRVRWEPPPKSANLIHTLEGHEGGVSAANYWTCRFLAEAGHDVHVVTNAFEIEPEYRMWLRDEDKSMLEPTLRKHSTKHGPEMLELIIEKIKESKPTPTPQVISSYYEPFIRGALGIAGAEYRD